MFLFNFYFNSPRGNLSPRLDRRPCLLSNFAKVINARPVTKWRASVTRTHSYGPEVRRADSRTHVRSRGLLCKCTVLRGQPVYNVPATDLCLKIELPPTFGASFAWRGGITLSIFRIAGTVTRARRDTHLVYFSPTSSGGRALVSRGEKNSDVTRGGGITVSRAFGNSITFLADNRVYREEYCLPLIIRSCIKRRGGGGGCMDDSTRVALCSGTDVVTCI